jgi:hypothetical protein
MTPQTRKRIGLVLILLLFAAPIVTAYVLNALGWRPSGHRNYGTMIEPPQDLTQARFMLDDGKALAWKDEDWSWTLIALPGPGCAAKCLERIDELRRARLTLNQNAYRVRVVVLDANVPDSAIESMKPVERARDADEKLSKYRPAASDDISAVRVDPHGFLILSYPSGYDGNLLKKDLA